MVFLSPLKQGVPKYFENCRDPHPYTIYILVSYVKYHLMVCKSRPYIVFLSPLNPVRIWVRIDPLIPLCVIRGD
jgi:hypothetical protein